MTRPFRMTPQEVCSKADELLRELQSEGLSAYEAAEMLSLMLGAMCAQLALKGEAEALDHHLDMVEAAFESTLDALAGPCNCPACTAARLN